MGRYKIVFRKSVTRDLNQIPKKDVRRILATINSLSLEPRPPGMEILSGREKCRVRQGDYRIIYEIKNDEVVVVVVVVRVGHQKDVYRKA
jgi:mRNA interferase RelE/StbE